MYSSIKLPIEIRIKTTLEFDETERLFDKILTMDKIKLPYNIELYIHKLIYIIQKDYTKHKAITFKNLILFLDNIETKEKMDQYIAELFNKFQSHIDEDDVYLYSIKSRNKRIYIINNNNEHHYYHFNMNLKKDDSNIDNRILFKVTMMNEVVAKFTPRIYDDAIVEISTVKKPILCVDETLKEKDPRILSNWLFMRSLFNYINTAPSDYFSDSLIKMLNEHEYLFDPILPFWDNILSKNNQEKLRILYPFLINIRGILRQDFDKVILNWTEMMDFLRRECSSDARNFIGYIAEKLNINLGEPNSLEEIQSILENYPEIKTKIGITFPYSKKAGRLYVTISSDNKRGLIK